MMSSDAFSVGAREGAQQIRAVEEAGVEEVRGYTPGLESEGAELEDGGCEAGLEECSFVG